MGVGLELLYPMACGGGDRYATPGGRLPLGAGRFPLLRVSSCFVKSPTGQLEAEYMGKPRDHTQRGGPGCTRIPTSPPTGQARE